ncbi:MAG: ferredoxin--NADP reductase [Gammaproteobacteria bacterium]
MTDWVEGKVIEQKQWTEHHYSLRFEAPIEPFEAGQFVRVALDIDGQRIARPYSCVNPPQDPVLEIYYDIIPEGPLSNRLPALEPDDTLFVASRAQGFFTLGEVPDGSQLWMLSTGTALGVFLSILRTEEPWRRFDRLVLVHAVRRVQDLVYRDIIDRIAERHADRFQYIPFVSREQTDFALSGHIPDAIREGQLEQRAGLEFTPDAQFMLCGNPGMLKDTTAVLGERGFRKNRRRDPGHITTERYWSEGSTP